MLAEVGWAVQDYKTFDHSASIGVALSGIEADFGSRQADNFHRDLRADYVLANPRFNDTDTALSGSTFLGSEAEPQVVSEAKDNFRKDDDVRWQFGVPPKGNANFAWVQHFIHHLTPQGMAGFSPANGSAAAGFSNQSGETIALN